MTEQEAKACLAGPLRFGDRHQIAAVDFLSALEDARNRYNFCPADHWLDVPCPNCDGSGQVLLQHRSEDGTEAAEYWQCPHCHGDEWIKVFDIEGCSCMDGVCLDVIKELKSKMYDAELWRKWIDQS